MKRYKGLIAVIMAAVLLTGCNRQESAAEEIYEKDPSWIVQKEEKKEEIKQPGNQIPDNFQIHFMDVGQGDAALIICDGHAMLIDAGDNTQGTFVQNYLTKMDISYLDMAVATHPDADHIGGMDVILQKFDCSKLLLPDVVKDTKTYEDLVNVIEYRNINAIHPYAGDSYGLGSAQISVLSPCRDDYDDVNDFSIVLKVSYGNTNFLFTGDASSEVEEEMLENGMDVSADVLKVGHHGSRTSSSEKFIEAVGAESAVISCGVENEYGHPAAAALNALRTNNAEVYRTDEQGTIVLYSDGNTITFNCAPSDTWKAGEYTGQLQSQEAPDGNSYTKYGDPEAFLKFQYEGKDKEAVKRWIEENVILNIEEGGDYKESTGQEETNSVADDGSGVSEVKDKASEAADNAKETVAGAVNGVVEKAPGIAGKIGKAVLSANEKYWEDDYMPPSYGNTEETINAAQDALKTENQKKEDDKDAE